MERAFLAALLLTIPLVGGTACTVTIGPWERGDACDPYWDYDDSQCENSDILLYCSETGVVAAMDCTSYCDGGYCGADPTGVSWDACICTEPCWEAGCLCNYTYEYDQGTCSADGDWLTYCSHTNVVGEISCSQQCVNWYGTGVVGYCGIQEETSYNGCVCEFDGCDFDPYCADAFYQVSCDGTQIWWTDCDEFCFDDGFDKGACDWLSGECICG